MENTIVAATDRILAEKRQKKLLMSKDVMVTNLAAITSIQINRS